MKNASLEELAMRRYELPRHLGQPKFWASWDSMLLKHDWKSAMRQRSIEHFGWEKDNFIAQQQVKTRLNDLNPKFRKRCVQCSASVSSYKHPDIITFHKHFSSIQRRVLHTTLDENSKTTCETCEEEQHFSITSDKYKIILTSEPLQGARDYRLQKKRDGIHVELTCIPYVSRAELFHGFLADYGGVMKEKPCDILILGFIYDIQHGDSVGEIVRDIRRFKTTVMGMNCVNSVAFATNYLPPCSTFLPGDTHNLTLKDVTNDLVYLNWMLMRINEEDSNPDVASAPKFHTWGLRTDPTKKMYEDWDRNVLRTKNTHDLSQWWNHDARARDLNLSASSKIYTACVKYFEVTGGILKFEKPEKEMRAAPPPPTPTPPKPLSDLPETSDISDTSFDSESTELQIFLNKEDDVTRVESQASTSKSTSQNIDDFRPVINKKLMGALHRYREFYIILSIKITR